MIQIIGPKLETNLWDPTQGHNLETQPKVPKFVPSHVKESNKGDSRTDEVMSELLLSQLINQLAKKVGFSRACLLL